MKGVSTEEDYKTYTKARYEQAARFYGIFDALVKGVCSKVVDIADAAPCARILDVATGTGSQAFAFAERRYSVVGIDLTEAMLDIAKRHNTYTNVSFKLADAAQMPFADDQFDVSSVSLTLHEMPSLVRERVLSRDGTSHRAGRDYYDRRVCYSPTNAWHALLVRLARWGEGKYFAEFVTSDFRGLLNKVGIQIRGANSDGHSEDNARGKQGIQREAHIYV